MLIATWNLAYGRSRPANARRLDLMSRIAADVWVLTETHDDVALDDFTPVHGANRPVGDGENRSVIAGSRWVTIWVRKGIGTVEDITPTRSDPRRVVAEVALLGGPTLVVYGTVLPWIGDKETGGMGAVLADQQPEWDCFRTPGRLLCVAGDFNVNLGGPHYYGSKEAKWAVACALRASDLVAVTHYEEEANETHGLVDHVAMPQAIGAAIHRTWGKRTDPGDEYLSDHRGVCIKVDLGGGAGR